MLSKEPMTTDEVERAIKLFESISTPMSIDSISVKQVQDSDQSEIQVLTKKVEMLQSELSSIRLSQSTSYQVQIGKVFRVERQKRGGYNQG